MDVSGASVMVVSYSWSSLMKGDEDGVIGVVTGAVVGIAKTPTKKTELMMLLYNIDGLIYFSSKDPVTGLMVYFLESVSRVP